MEIPAWSFISFWAVISITSLHLGFGALEKTELSNSVSPVVMFLFKHSLAISSCFSSSYALEFRSQSTYTIRSNYFLLLYVLISIIFPRTIEGILIWQALTPILACLLYFLTKLKIFFHMIFRIPASLLLPIFRFLWRKILPLSCIVIVLPLLLQCLESPSISSLVVPIISALIGILFKTIYYYTLSRLFSATAFLWAPIFTFLFYIFCFWLFCVLAYAVFLILKDNFSELRARSAILLALEISLFFTAAKKKRDFSPILVLFISHLISVLWAALPRFGDYTLVSADANSTDSEGLEGLVNVGVRFVGVKMKGLVRMLKEHRAKKFVEFAVGTVGAILFQNFFRITSFSEVAAFLYIAVTWLANLVLLGFGGDFGVFNFLLANVVVGCTVGQYGLHGATWVALAGALLLFALRLKLESLHTVYGEGQRLQLSS